MCFPKFSSRIIVGLLTIFAMYYAGFGWLPASFTEARILKFIVNGYPLLGYLPLDLLAIVFLLSATPYILKCSIKEVAVQLVLALVSYLAYIVLGYVQILSLLSISTATTVYVYVKRLGLKKLLISTSYVVIFLEVLAIFSSLTYFATGSWNPIAKSIVLRERFVWSFLEWFSIATLTASSIMWLYSFLSGRSYPLKLQLNKVLGNSELGFVGVKALSASLLLCLLVVILPHIPTVNPTLAPVSTDTFLYVEFIREANSNGLLYALAKYRSFARPLYLAVLFTASKIVDPLILVDIIHPLLAISFLTVATYFFTKKFVGLKAASIAALLTPLGHTAVTFIAGGFQANTLALPLALIMFTIEPSRKLKLFTLAVLIALIHPWTYIMFSTAYIVYTIGVKRSKLGIKNAFSAAIVFASAMILSEAVDLAVANISPSAAALTTVANSIGFYVPISLFRGVEFLTWGSQANALVFLASSLPAVFQPTSAILCSIASLLLISSQTIVHRLILNTPLEAHSSIILEKLDGKIVLAVILATIAKGLIMLTGLTPFTTNIWLET